MRARDTARLACQALNVEPVEEESLADGFDRDDALELLLRHGPDARVLVVGHDPSFTQVVHDFTSGRIDFKKGGVAAVRAERAGGELLLLLRPRELESLAVQLSGRAGSSRISRTASRSRMLESWSAKAIQSASPTPMSSAIGPQRIMPTGTAASEPNQS